MCAIRSAFVVMMAPKGGGRLLYPLMALCKRGMTTAARLAATSTTNIVRILLPYTCRLT